MIFSATRLALAQLPDPRFRGVLLRGLAITLALLITFYVGGLTLLNLLLPDSITLPLIGEVGWIDNIASIASLLVMLLASAFLMVPVAATFTGLFLDEVAAAVEERHYAGLPPARHVGIGESLRDALGFLGVLLAANLAALVLYIAFAPLAPLIFWGLNGFLLGREYFQLVALRRLGRDEARRARRRHLIPIWILGPLMAVPLTVPVLNLIVPVLGVAAFTHLFQSLNRGQSD